MNGMLEYRVTPSVNVLSGTILLNEEMIGPSPSDVLRDRFSTQVCHTRDKAIREALIKLGWTPPPDPSAARREGERAGVACAKKAERTTGFDTKAAGEAMIDALRIRGVTSGEALVEAARAAGHVPHDDRAFGPVICKLARQGRIYDVGRCHRERGHGTSGGRLWRLSDRPDANKQ